MGLGLAAAGASVAMVDLDEAAVEAAANDAREGGGTAGILAAGADVAREEDAATMVQRSSRSSRC